MIKKKNPYFIFTIKIIIFNILILISCTLILFQPKLDENNYLAAIIDKHKLIETVESPRLIFLGGSNLAFGLKSEELVKEFNYQVVNMGLHAGVGTNYMLNEAKPYIRSGDIVILVFEYDKIIGAEADNTILELLLFYPKGLRFIKKKQFAIFIKNLPKSLQRRFIGIFNSNINPIYNRDGFNRYGDLISHEKYIKPFQKLSGGFIIPDYFYNGTDKFISIMNDFNDYVIRKGAKIYFLYPCIPNDVYDENIKNLSKLNKYLRRIQKIKILCSPSDYAFPYDYFFDTIYHLNGKGRDMRVKKIINDLKKVINKRDLN